LQTGSILLSEDRDQREMKSRVVEQVAKADDQQPGNANARLLPEFHASTRFCFCVNVLVPPAPGFWNHAHAVPVVGELFATIQTDDVSAGLPGRIRPALRSPAGLRKAHALVPAAEQKV
jgi:hypothetical protein